jgi:hypothetical protein
MSKPLIVGEFMLACKRIHKSYSPFSFTLADESHAANVKFTQHLFTYMEHINLAFASGIASTSDRECSLVIESKGMAHIETVHFAPVVDYGRMPFVLQRLKQEPHIAMFEVIKKQEQYCPIQFKKILRNMAIAAAQGDTHFDAKETSTIMLQQLANDENPHGIPRIRSEKRYTYVLDAKENILWMKQDSANREMITNLHKLMHRVAKVFEEKEYQGAARLRSSYDSTYSTNSVNIKPYPDYASVIKSLTSGAFNTHHIMQHLSASTKDVNELDITYSAQLSGREDASAKTSFKNALAPFLQEVEIQGDNKFLKLVTFADDKNMDIAEVRLEVALEADEELTAYIHEFYPEYLSEAALGNELTSECKVSAAQGNMKIELTNNAELKTFMKGMFGAFDKHNDEENIHLVKGEKLTLDMLGNAAGMLVSTLNLYIDLLHEVKKRDSDFGMIADRYESQRSNG